MPAWETRGGVLGPQGWVFPCVGLCWVWNSSGSLTLPPPSLLGVGSPSAFPSGKFCPSLLLQQHNHGGRGSLCRPPPRTTWLHAENPPSSPLIPARPVDAPTCRLQGFPAAPTWGCLLHVSFYLRSDSRCQTPCPAPPGTPLHLESLRPALWVRACLRTCLGACPCVGTHVASRGNSGCSLLCK